MRNFCVCKSVATFILVAILVGCGPYLRVDEAEKICIPDPNLKRVLLAEYDSNRDGEISVIEAEAITRVICKDCEISDLTGLESCPNLTIIYCSGNSISTIDLHTLTQLRTLNCAGNPVKSLILDNCADLRNLLVQGTTTNAISGTTISFSAYAQAATFDFSIRNTPFTAFKFTDAPSVTSLVFDGDFTDVDISGNTAITSLDLRAITQLKTLDVTDNASLTRVICPSQEWLCKLLATSDIMLFEDKTGNSIIGGSVKIDGQYWGCWNAGYTVDNLYGNEYTFDDAQKACPVGWRTPTKTELESLSKNYSSVVTVNGMLGRWFSGSKAYSESVPAIFLPYLKGFSDGFYWSSTENWSNYTGYALYFNSSKVGAGGGDLRSATLSVRCLKD